MQSFTVYSFWLQTSKLQHTMNKGSRGATRLHSSRNMSFFSITISLATKALQQLLKVQSSGEQFYKLKKVNSSQ
jgi:hypothetical protein